MVCLGASSDMAAYTIDVVGDVFTSFSSATIRYGAPGMGKSVHLHETGERFYKRGSKIIGLNDDEGRFEYLFYAFPGRDDMWKHFCQTQLHWGNVKVSDWLLIKEGKKTFEDVFPWKPETYPVECYIPALPGKYSYPSVFKPFTISFSSLSLYEFKILLGKITTKQSRTVDLAWSRMKVNKVGKTFENFIQILKGFISNRKIQAEDMEYNICESEDGLDLLIKIEKVWQLGLISTKEDPYNLNLARIMWDTKTISGFSFFNISDGNVRYVLYGWLLRRIRDVRNKALLGKVMFPELCLLIHELQDIAPARGQEETYSVEGQRISTAQLVKLAKKPRDIKVRIHADTQNPLSLWKPLRESFSTTFIFRCDRAVVDSIRALTYFDDATYIGLQRSKTGVHCVKSAPTGGRDYSGVNFPMLSLPPTSMCKTPDDLFRVEWERYGGEFTDWDFEVPETLITIKKARSKEKKALSTRQQKVYMVYARFVLKVITKNPGIYIKDILLHPDMCQELELTSTEMYEVCKFLAAKNMIEKRQEGTYTACYANSDNCPVEDLGHG